MTLRRRITKLGSVLLLLFMVALVGVSLAAQKNAAESMGDAAAVIDPDKIRAHVKFLASDLLEGRGTGQRGGDIAAEYIATQFELYGLKPGAENGSYFQDVPMVGVKTLPDTSFKLVPANGKALALKNLDDFVSNNESQTETADFDAPVVFVGYGISAPEYRWDDYKGVDLKEQRDFPFEVNALVIVPAVFRRTDAVTHKNDRSVEIRGFRLAFVIGDEIIEIFQSERFPVRWNQLERSVRQRFHANHRNVLKIAAVFGSRLQTVEFQLSGN